MLEMLFRWNNIENDSSHENMSYNHRYIHFSAFGALPLRWLFVRFGGVCATMGLVELQIGKFHFAIGAFEALGHIVYIDVV